LEFFLIVHENAGRLAWRAETAARGRMAGTASGERPAAAVLGAETTVRGAETQREAI